MTVNRTISGDQSTRSGRVSELCEIDLAWQKTREQYLDNGYEPRPLDGRSLIVVSSFFLLSWGFITWGEVARLTPAITATTVVGFASLRSRSFERVYQQYLQQRSVAGLRVGDSKSAADQSLPGPNSPRRLS